MAGVVVGSNIVTERFAKIVQAVEEVNAELLFPRSCHATNQQTILETGKLSV